MISLNIDTAYRFHIKKEIKNKVFGFIAIMFHSKN